MKKIVIIEGLETSKVSPYEHPSVLAKRAEISAEINKHVVQKPVYDRWNSEVIKAEKAKYKKLSKESKESFLKELLTKFIKDIPNWNFTVTQCK